MKRSNSSEIKRGQAISFRVPSDIPDHLLKHLQKLKEVERRNFSSKIAEFVMQGVGQSFTREKESITIPLPHKLSKSERDWLKHEHSEALLGSVIYQLLTDPRRVTALFTSISSNSLDINEALYLQEEERLEEHPVEIPNSYEETAAAIDFDDLDSFDWKKAKQDQPVIEEEENENDLDSLLGDFLAKMNK
jgi:hypothetical protein